MVYIVSPVAYDEKGYEIDRAFDSHSFRTIYEAEDYISNLGSTWIMYPNIEILRVPSSHHFARSQVRFVKGFSEFGEYGPVSKRT